MVRVDVEAPRQFSLEGNASNPFRDQTTIVFTPPDAGHVRLDVFDVLGRRVAQLVNQELAARLRLTKTIGAIIDLGCLSRLPT